MLLLHLPNKLLQRIAEEVEFAEHINALAGTNTRLYNLLNPSIFIVAMSKNMEVQHYGGLQNMGKRRQLINR